MPLRPRRRRRSHLPRQWGGAGRCWRLLGCPQLGAPRGAPGGACLPGKRCLLACRSGAVRKQGTRGDLSAGAAAGRRRGRALATGEQATAGAATSGQRAPAAPGASCDIGARPQKGQDGLWSRVVRETFARCSYVSCYGQPCQEASQCEYPRSLRQLGTAWPLWAAALLALSFPAVSRPRGGHLPLDRLDAAQSSFSAFFCCAWACTRTARDTSSSLGFIFLSFRGEQMFLRNALLQYVW